MFADGISRELITRSLWLSFLAIVVSGCRVEGPPAAHVDPHPVNAVAKSSGGDAPGRPGRCEAQAARVAASTVRREDRGRPPRWEAHYSEKYDQCYVLIDRRISDRNGAQAVVSELWEAFDAALLAIHSASTDEAVNRGYCQVSLSDDPFTSCMVSKFFIDEHMQH